MKFVFTTVFFVTCMIATVEVYYDERVGILYLTLMFIMTVFNPWVFEGKRKKYKGRGVIKNNESSNLNLSLW